MHKLDGSWFTEIAAEEGVALSLQGRRLQVEQTPYQNIEIYETDSFGTMMVIDGCVMLTDRAGFIYHEMLAHPALFAHPAPRRVLIIGDSTDPVGPAEELFSESFYRECLRVLRADGILVQQSESPFFYAQTILDVHRSLKAAAFADARTLTFPQPTYPSGWWSATLAKKDGRLNSFRRRDAEEKPFPTRYYSAT